VRLSLWLLEARMELCRTRQQLFEVSPSMSDSQLSIGWA
jgi:hypothetical protein